MLPLVSRALLHHQDALPAAIVERLRAYSLALRLRNTYLARELREVVGRLEDAGIPALPFKGPMLAVQLYADVALRQYSDLDLLIRPRDAQRARLILEARQYALDPALAPPDAAFAARLSGEREARYLRSRSEHHFVRSEDNLTIDLHLALADPFIRFPVSLEQLLARSDAVQLEGQRVPGLSAEDTLLMLSLNGAKDGWERLQRTCDVAALLSTQAGLDEAAVLRRARALGALRMLRVSLSLARSLLQANVPDLLARDMATDTTAQAIARAVQAHLFEPGERPPELTLAYLRAYLRTRERLRDRVWPFVYLAVTPSVADWRAIRLPVRLWGLYYVVRPARLAWRYASNGRSTRATSCRSWPASSR